MSNMLNYIILGSALSFVIMFIILYLKILPVLNNFNNLIEVISQSKIQEMINSSVLGGCSYAEQEEFKAFKPVGISQSGVSGDILGNHKLSKACEYIIKDMKSHGIILTEEDVKDRIEAHLGMSTLSINSFHGNFPIIREDPEDEINNFDVD